MPYKLLFFLHIHSRIKALSPRKHEGNVVD